MDERCRRDVLFGLAPEDSDSAISRLYSRCSSYNARLTISARAQKLYQLIVSQKVTFLYARTDDPKFGALLAYIESRHVHTELVHRSDSYNELCVYLNRQR